MIDSLIDEVTKRKSKIKSSDDKTYWLLSM